jgi:omega-6 fatty acid desaturase (delta-12 desaturase)
MTSSIDHVKQHKHLMIGRFGKSDNTSGWIHTLTTLLPLAALWWLAVQSAAVSWWLTAGVGVLITLFSLRVFSLMHDCGHGSLFRSHTLNRGIGFLMGVISGMPQYVWAQHHAYHHTHNCNMDKYRGPYTTLSTDEYAAMSAGQQSRYRTKCSIVASPIAGFIYLILMPRLNWARGTVGLVRHIVARRLSRTNTPLGEDISSYRSRYWKNPREYRHMLWNNLVLLSLWALMCWACGPKLFFAVYLISLSFAGAIGITLFNLQHNFEHAYANRNAGWDHDTAAIEGTSFLVLPAWLNWFTANIGYHHIHHISAAIPSYQLRRCHQEYKHLFDRVVRLKLRDVIQASRCILWDSRAQRIITVAEYQQLSSQPSPQPT